MAQAGIAIYSRLNSVKKHIFNILLISDDLAQCDKLAGELSLRGFSSVSCQNLEDALMSLAEKGFGLAVALIRSNPVEHKRFIRKIRRKKHDLPIIVIFDNVNDDDRVEMLDAGADEVLTSFADTDTIIEKIKFYSTISVGAQSKAAADAASGRSLPYSQRKKTGA